jgi:histidine kinase
MVIQAGAARTVLADQPGTATEQLLALESGGREALTELRGMLDLLAGAADDDSPREPAAGLAQAEDLVAQVQTAGLPVRLRVRGSGPPCRPAWI